MLYTCTRKFIENFSSMQPFRGKSAEKMMQPSPKTILYPNMDNLIMKYVAPFLIMVEGATYVLFVKDYCQCLTLMSIS